MFAGIIAPGYFLFLSGRSHSMDVGQQASPGVATWGVQTT